MLRDDTTHTSPKNGQHRLPAAKIPYWIGAMREETAACVVVGDPACAHKLHKLARPVRSLADGAPRSLAV